jgi:hypothetical protein
MAIRMQLFERSSPHVDQYAPGRLRTVLPSQLPGWRVSDEMLGQNEGVSASVRRVLNFDDYVYRRFERAGTQFTIYVAHWTSGRMPTRLIAEHTPDRCWIENGWKCILKKVLRDFKAGDLTFKPAQWRMFAQPQSETPYYVMFWLIVGQTAYDFDAHQNMLTHVWRWWEGVLQEAQGNRKDHIFVRIVSQQPLETLAPDPSFQSAVRGLATLGLAEQAMQLR